MIAKIFALLLHSIVGQVDHFIIDVIQTILTRRCSNIPILIPISFQNSIGGCDKQVTPDVELSIVYAEMLIKFFTGNIFQYISELLLNGGLRFSLAASS